MTLNATVYLAARSKNKKEEEKMSHLQEINVPWNNNISSCYNSNIHFNKSRVYDNNVSCHSKTVSFKCENEGFL